MFNNYSRKRAYDIFTITVILARSCDFFQAAFVHPCEVSNITMRPLVGLGVVIHVAVTVFPIHSPWFASAVANELISENTIMPHAKVVSHFMSNDLIIKMKMIYN